MKKTYIIPEIAVTKLVSRKRFLLEGSAHINGLGVTYGGVSTGGMTSDSRQDNSWDIWGTGDDIED